MPNIFEEIAQRANNASQALENNVQESQIIAAERVNVFQQAKDELEERNKTVETLTQQHSDISREINARKAKAADNILQAVSDLDEYEDINIFRKIGRSIFNPSKAPEGINKRVERNALELRGLSVKEAAFDDQYQTEVNAILQTTGYRRQVLEASDQLLTARQQLSTTTANGAAQLLGNSIDTLIRNEKLAASKVNTLDENDIARALSSNDNTDYVTYEGVEIPRTSLQDRRRQLENQRIAIKSAQLGLKSQEIAYTQSVINNQILPSMNLNDVATALGNNGVFNGIQLDLADLQNRYVQLQSTGDRIAIQNFEDKNSTPGLVKTLRTVQQQIPYFSNRIEVLTGSKELPVNLQSSLAQIENLGNGIKEYYKNPENPKNSIQAKIFNEQVAAAYENFQKEIDKTITNYAGKNGTLKNVATQFVLGGQISPNMAADTLYDAIETGINPETLGLSGPAKDTYMAANDIYLDALAKASGTSNEALKNLNPEQLTAITQKTPKFDRRAVRVQIGKVLANKYTSDTIESTIRAIPALAKRAGNPLAKLSQTEWNDAVQTADEFALSAIGNQIGLAGKEKEIPGIVNNIINGRAIDETAANNIKQYLGVEKLDKNAGILLNERLNRETAVALPKALRRYSNRIGDPNEALEDFIASGVYEDYTKALPQNLQNSSLGGYLISQLQPKSVVDGLNNYLGNISVGLREYKDRANKFNEAAARIKQQDPRTYFRMLVAQSNGIPLEEENAFIQYLGKNLPTTENVIPGVTGGSTGVIVEEVPNWSTALEFIRSNKLTDPKMELTRKKLVTSINEMDLERKTDRALAIQAAEE